MTPRQLVYATALGAPVSIAVVLLSGDGYIWFMLGMLFGGFLVLAFAPWLRRHR